MATVTLKDTSPRPTEIWIHEALNLKQETYNLLVEKVPQAVIKAIQTEETPNAVRADAIRLMLDQVYMSGIYDLEFTEDRYKAIALIGVMVEQAYNAAVLQSQQNKPFFGKIK